MFRSSSVTRHNFYDNTLCGCCFFFVYRCRQKKKVKIICVMLLMTRIFIASINESIRSSLRCRSFRMILQVAINIFAINQTRLMLTCQTIERYNYHICWKLTYFYMKIFAPKMDKKHFMRRNWKQKWKERK